MTGRRVGAIVALLTGLTLSVGSMATARPASEDAAPLPPEAFVTIVAPASRSIATVAPTQAPPPAIPDFREPPPSHAPRVAVRQAVEAEVVVVPTPTPTPAPRPRARPRADTAGGGHRVRGEASWYCMSGVSPCHHAYSGGMYAAAGPALRVGDWRGRSVRVCHGGRCVTVRLVDWCQCYGSRVIDLYSDAFERLASTSEGTITVTVSW